MTASDDDLAAHINAIGELPLDQRAEALEKAAETLRQLLDQPDSSPSA